MTGVAIVSAVSVVPRAPAALAQCFAAPVDHHEILYFRDVYFYPSSKKPFDLVVDELRESLSIALVDYSFLAAQIKDGTATFENAGVMFYVAHTAATLSDSECLGYCSIKDQLCQGSGDHSDFKVPICQIQMTKFRCGGIAIGIAILEEFSSSAALFHKDWASINRGSRSNSRSDQLSLRNIDSSSGCEFVHEAFLVRQDTVGDLVCEIGGGPYGYEQPTSLEAISAFIWLWMTIARDIPDEASTRFNASCSAQAGDLKSRHISYAASIIHSKVKEQSGDGSIFKFDTHKDVKCVTLPAYIDTDFGWGEPVHYSPSAGDGTAFIFPKSHGIGVEIQIKMPKVHMQRLLSSKGFLDICSKKCGAVSLDAIFTVAPAVPTKQPCWVPLSNLDKILFKSSYLKSVHYYKPSPCIPDFANLVEELKESLSKVLVDHYVFAGRLQVNDRGEKAINCNDAGITLRVAHAHARLDEWDDSLEDALNAPDWLIEDVPTAPFFHMQVTRFACGGIAMGQTCTELVLDGYSGLVFQKSWAEVNRGDPMSTVPVFKPELLKPRDPPVVNVPVRDYVAVPPHNVDDYMADTAAAAPTSFVQRIFLLTSDKSGDLVREIEDGPYGYGRATSFEALTALFWKSITAVRGLSDVDTTRFCYNMSLRGGTRWQPPLPPGYFGNAVYTPSLPGNAGHVGTRHVSYAARLIHEDILGISTETVKSCIDWMELSNRNGDGVMYKIDTYGGKDVNCTSIHTFPAYDVDFGWGRPIHFSLVLHAMFGELVFILPSQGGGRNREILVQLRQDHMDKLLQCSNLRKFVTTMSKKEILKNRT